MEICFKLSVKHLQSKFLLQMLIAFIWCYDNRNFLFSSKLRLSSRRGKWPKKGRVGTWRKQILSYCITLKRQNRIIWHFFLRRWWHCTVVFFFFFFNLFIYLFLAALGLRCCAWAFSSCGKWALLFIAVCGLLIAVSSLVAEHRL